MNKRQEFTTPDSEEMLQSEKIHPEIMVVVAYLTSILDSYALGSSRLRALYGIEVRGCGPSSFVLSLLIQESLRDQGINLEVDAIIERPTELEDGIHMIYGLHTEGGRWSDHVWIEVALKGQVLFVSHESDPHSVRASFRAIVVHAHHTLFLYDQIGLKAFGSLQEMQQMRLFSPETIAQLFGVINSINEGSLPENYEDYAGFLLGVIKET